MTILTKHITIGNEVLSLTNQRAIYWKREEALILSDVHIGKTAHFRKHGIPVPDDVLQRDLSRLKELILHFNAQSIFIVGDLFHAERNSDIATFKTWLNQFVGIQWILIKGNHDRLPHRIMDGLQIKVVRHLELDPFVFIHENTKNANDLFIISGHTHPGVVIKGRGKQRIKLPCYQLSTHQLILPAFSLFTGLNTACLSEEVINYAFTDTEIFQF